MPRAGLPSSRGMNVSRALVVAVALSTISLGCATARPIGPLDTSSAGYRDASFQDAELKASGVAVLPVTADHPMDVAVAERVGPRVALAIENRQVCAVVLRPADVKERFARDGVSERFLKMLAELPERRELDRATLDAMAQSTGCRYFLQAAVRTGNAYDVAGGHGSRAVTSDIFVQLWDASTGDVVWEGIGGGAALTNPPHGGTTEQAMALAVSGAAALLGRDPASLPAPHVLAELHERDHIEAMATADENHARADAAVTGLHLFAAFAEIAVAIADIAD